jgi:hypothetical protein
MRRALRFYLALAAPLLGIILASGCGHDNVSPPSGVDGGGVAHAGLPGAGGGLDANAGQAEGGAVSTAGGASSLVGEAGAELAGGAGSGGCNEGKGATITGRVLAPNGLLPLAGVNVYVPSSTVDPLPYGASCWRCSLPLPGMPIALTTTDADGRFELSHAPVGEAVPLVVQTGKWQRVLSLPSVIGCQENPTDEAATRLPSQRSEGNLPRIALVTGGEDRLECLLRKLGIDDSEFASTADGGRVRLYAGLGGSARLAAADPAELGFTPAAELWSDPEALSLFDLVLLTSETAPNAVDKGSLALTALHDYAAHGGRVLLQHFQNYFLEAGGTDVSSIASFSPQPDLADPFVATVDTASARGKAFSASLAAVELAAELRKLSIHQGKNTVTAVHAPAVRLLYGESPSTVQAFSLDLPYGAAGPSCGRITATDLLTASADTLAEFPDGCTTTELNAQERALAFLLFDLGACL